MYLNHIEYIKQGRLTCLAHNMN